MSHNRGEQSIQLKTQLSFKLQNFEHTATDPCPKQDPAGPRYETLDLFLVFRIRIHMIRKFFDLPDPDPIVREVRIRILLSSSKYSMQMFFKKVPNKQVI